MDYVTFVEAMRKRRVVQDMGLAPPKQLDDFYRKQDWAIPSYDFGPQLDLVRGRAPKFFDMLDRWLLEGRFRLPFPECAILIEFPYSHMVIRAMEQDDGSVVLQPYNRPKKRLQLERIPYAIRFGGEVGSWTRGLTGPVSPIWLDLQEESEVDEDHVNRWASFITTFVTRAAFILAAARPDDECLVFTDPETPALVAANKGRAYAGLAPLPATRVLNLRLGAVDTIVLKQEREGHHSPKSPHLRRGHERRYKNGKVVWIDATSVKGGSVAASRKVVVDL